MRTVVSASVKRPGAARLSLPWEPLRAPTHWTEALLRPRSFPLALLLATACGGDARDEGQSTGLTAPATGAEDPGTSGGPETSDESGDAPAGSSGDETGQTSGAESSTGGDLGDPDYSNIARLQVPASWATGPGNTWTYDFTADLPPDYEIAREFYVEHPDDYDFLVVYTEGEFDEFFAHAVGVQENISGIRFGAEPMWSQAEAAGSAGRLQQVSLMNSPSLYPDPGAADILIHETVHRWSAFLGLQGAPSLLGPAGGHWNIHLSTGGPSATGYGELIDTGGGSFRFDVIYPLQISPLELYVAGLIPAAEVPPLFYVANATGYDPAVNPWGETLGPTSYGEDATFTGDRVDFTIDDIIASNGPRLPAFGDAPTHFRFAFALVCADVTACDENDLAIVEQQRVAFASQFPAATGQLASIETEL